MLSRLQIKLRDDPSRKVLIVQKILAQTLPWARLETAQGVLDFGQRHASPIRDFAVIHKLPVNNILRKGRFLPKLFTRERPWEKTSLRATPALWVSGRWVSLCPPMKKSGCVIIVLFLAVCGSMFVNLLLIAALVGMKGSNVASVRTLKAKEFDEVVVRQGDSGAGKIAVIPLEGVIAHGADRIARGQHGG